MSRNIKKSGGGLVIGVFHLGFHLSALMMVVLDTQVNLQHKVS